MECACNSVVRVSSKSISGSPGSFQTCAPISCTPAQFGGISGLTVVEMIIVLIIITVVAVVAVPAISGYVDDMQNAEAISRLTVIELSLDKYYAENGRYPDSLARIGKEKMKDPWGHAYVYMPIPKDKELRQLVARKSREIRLINTDYDLYSPGKDGRTDLCVNKKRCWDDIIRAYNGSYTGLVMDIL